MFIKEDIITCESYKRLCDQTYKPGMSLKTGLYHVNFEELPFFLEETKKSPEKYVVVSSCSDFGLAYQQYDPVWVDAYKWARMMITPEMGYNNVMLQTRCNKEKCNLEDRFSVKCYAWTAYTFPAIPDNIVHWFMTNSRVRPSEEPKITIIPFGVAANGAEAIATVAQEGIQKEPKLYVNWVNYTVERLDIRQHYEMFQQDDIVVVNEAKSYKDYLRDIARHVLVLSPEGNGVDCYRTLEAVYLDSLPIVQLSATTAELADLPIAIVRSLVGLNPKGMWHTYLTMKEQKRSFEKAKLSYWKKRFEDERNKINIH